MKKFLACVTTIVIIILLVVLFKNITTPKYSHSDIVALINKGIENMDNISFDEESKNITSKYYFKGNKRKAVFQDNNLISITLEDGKIYRISKERKLMTISPSSVITDIRGLQNDALEIEDFNKNSAYREYEFAYIRDEKIENKDCIFVKERIFRTDTREYVDRPYGSKNEVRVYWIEKSTGIVIGRALMGEGKDTATPQTIIRNIKLGEVTDDVFNDMLEIPNDYTVFEKTSDGNVERIK